MNKEISMTEFEQIENNLHDCEILRAETVKKIRTFMEQNGDNALRKSSKVIELMLLVHKLVEVNELTHQNLIKLECLK